MSKLKRYIVSGEVTKLYNPVLVHVLYDGGHTSCCAEMVEDPDGLWVRASVNVPADVERYTPSLVHSSRDSGGGIYQATMSADPLGQWVRAGGFGSTGKR